MVQRSGRGERWRGTGERDAGLHICLPVSKLLLTACHST